MKRESHWSSITPTTPTNQQTCAFLCPTPGAQTVAVRDLNRDTRWIENSFRLEVSISWLRTLSYTLITLRWDIWGGMSMKRRKQSRFSIDESSFFWTSSCWSKDSNPAVIFITNDLLTCLQAQNHIAETHVEFFPDDREANNLKCFTNKD
jgi:hypothetical protein